MLIIGHRGAAGVPENTIGSFKKAEEFGVDMIEIDLRADSNGRIVAIHDFNELREYREAPELKVVLSAIKTAVNLEIKETGFEKQLLKEIKEFPSEILISSFKPQVLKKIRTLDRKIRLGALIDPEWNNYFYPLLVLSKYLKVYSIHPHHSLVTPLRMWWMRKMGFKVFPWVINDSNQYDAAKKLGVDGVITDRPDIIKK